MNTIITYDEAVKLNKLGFDKETAKKYGCVYTFESRQFIRPEIIEKYGELTDDGYYELTTECDGELEFNEVYYNVQVAVLNRYFWDEPIIYAPTYAQVAQWMYDMFGYFIHVKNYCPINGKILFGANVYSTRTYQTDVDYDKIIEAENPFDVERYVVQKFIENQFA